MEFFFGIAWVELLKHVKRASSMVLAHLKSLCLEHPVYPCIFEHINNSRSEASLIDSIKFKIGDYAISQKQGIKDL